LKVFILATCKNPELFAYTKLVFETLRIGFPNARIFVDLNNLEIKQEASIKEIAEELGCIVRSISETIHHKWLAEILKKEVDPFWIVDTDVIFYKEVESWTTTNALFGARIPEFIDEFTGAQTKARLHTSLLRIDPVGVNEALKSYFSTQNITEFNPHASLIYPQVVAVSGIPNFYDTLASLYHAIGGEDFKPHQKDSYFHFHFGTFSDRVLEKLQDSVKIKESRERVLSNSEVGKGLWRVQEQFFRDRCPYIKRKALEDNSNSNELCAPICLGNLDALHYCNLWFKYCHGIDDLLDTSIDGRPIMSKEEILSLFFQAACLFNSKFFVEHRQLLFPIVLQVTNTYADSVEWEQSPKAHLRVIADVLRTCGNEMLIMVALICGGEKHMRTVSQVLKEKAWLLQHDNSGNPK